MRIELSENELYTRGGVLDRLISSTFDAALLINNNGYILYHCNNSSDLTKLPSEAVGKHINDMKFKSSHLKQVLKTTKACLGVIDVVQGRKCLVNIYPIFSEGKLIGALATVLYSSLSALKKIITQMKVANPDGNDGDIFNIVARIGTSITFQDYIGASATTKDLIFQCSRAAASHRSILLIGETGTGKEILASAIHSELMGDTWKPFIKLNCSAIPKDLLESELFGHEKGAFTGAVATKKGKFELAGNGSILLDEIGDMDILMQTKLLRVLEEKEYERVGGTQMLPMTSRVIAATNCDLREKCRQSTFRSDLYYRLSEIVIKVPPLRERKEDIVLLIDNFKKRDQLEFTLEPEAIKVFYEYDWPGNVRELRNIVNRIGIYFNDLTVSAKDVYSILKDSMEFEATGKHEPLPSNAKDMSNITPAELEKQWLIQLLRDCNYNVVEASRRMGVCRATVYNKLNRHGIRAGRS